MSQVKRPLSPHLTIYKPQLTSVMSITHRITGLALVAGSILLVAWLWAAAYSPSVYGQIQAIFASPVGALLLMGWTVAFYYHLCNGIRHLFWDMGKGFDLPNVYRSGVAVIIFALILSAFTWGMALSVSAQQ